MTVFALIVAAGDGTRAKASDDPRPKQYRDIGGRPVLTRSMSVYATHPDVDKILVVVNPSHMDFYRNAEAGLPNIMPPAHGGPDRMGSVRLGLEALAGEAPDIVLIHDAARPFVSAGTISKVIAAAVQHGGALPVLSVYDTIQEIDGDGRVVKTPDRATMRLAQTPQGFRFADILAAHRMAAGQPETFTDDASIAIAAGLTVVAIDGDPKNRKLTTGEDFSMREADGAGCPQVSRTATGFDVHAFGPGSAIVLGGVTIPHTHALVGHSDADVALHALTDALLGTAGDGDIGAHFPPDDPKWRGAPSAHFLQFAVDRIKAKGGIIDLLDITIICEAPKIGGHRDALRLSIAGICGVDTRIVSIKATTTESLGFAGRGEGIAAMACATVRYPE